jgi:hypothetical protein
VAESPPRSGRVALSGDDTAATLRLYYRCRRRSIEGMASPRLRSPRRASGQAPTNALGIGAAQALRQPPLGSLRDRQDRQETPKARRPLCLAVTPPWKSRERDLRRYTAGQAGIGKAQPEGTWSSGFPSVRSIVSLQYDLPFCGFCGIVSSLGSHNKIPQKGCHESYQRRTPQW